MKEIDRLKSQIQKQNAQLQNIQSLNQNEERRGGLEELYKNQMLSISNLLVYNNVQEHNIQLIVMMLEENIELKLKIS